MKKEPVISHYEVVQAGTVIFQDPCRAICNSFICRNQIMGVRPTEVYLDDED